MTSTITQPRAAIATQRVKFSPEEDQKLKDFVKQWGPNWKIISTQMGSRTPRQCRTRYQNYLAPGYFNGEWTKEEDALLVEKFQLFGSHWKEIKKFFPARTANALKNRWNYYTSKNETLPCTNNNNNNNINNKNMLINEKGIDEKQGVQIHGFVGSQRQPQQQQYYYPNYLTQPTALIYTTYVNPQDFHCLYVK